MLRVIDATATATSSSLKSDGIAFVRGVGTTVANSAGESMSEAENVEDAVEVAFVLGDDVEDAAAAG